MKNTIKSTNIFPHLVTASCLAFTSLTLIPAQGAEPSDSETLRLADSSPGPASELRVVPGEPRQEVAQQPGTTDNGATTTPTPAKKHYALSALPLRVASIVTGTVVGTPVCMVRCSIWEEKYATRGMVGDTDDKFLQTAAGTFWLPLGVMTGVAEAPFSALKRSYVNSDKPFGKDQFSLGHIDWK